MGQDHDEPAEARERAFRILRRHGRASTSFQTLERGFSYYFAADGFVAYKDTGPAWVAAGEPVAPCEQVAELTEQFVREARRNGRRPCFFAVGAELVEAAALRATPIGDEPIWDPAQWAETLRRSRRLREQIRRARAKGVRTRVLDVSEVRESSPLRPQLERVAAQWLDSRRMAPMSFLVQLDPFALPEERVFVVAERQERVIALLVAVPVYDRDGWLVEHVLREPEAPNGTTDALADRLLRTLAERGCRWVSLGLSPLGGPVSLPFRAARRVSRPFYNFEGLRAFKARLRPQRWERRYLARPLERGPVGPVLDTLVAFTPRGLLPFARGTWRHLPARHRYAVLLALLLCLGVVVFALGTGTG